MDINHKLFGQVFSPGFLCMSNIKQKQIAGPEHMSEFVDSVKETFVNFAVKRKINVKGMLSL